MKRGAKHARLVRLPFVPGDDGMADMLLGLLAQVRTGRVKGYALCMIVEDAEGGQAVVHAAEPAPDAISELALLGAMRAAEHRLIAAHNARLEETP